MNRNLKAILAVALCLCILTTTCLFNSLGVQAQSQGNGLKGDYFDNMDLTDLKVSRIDTSINFDWGEGSPDSKISSDTFSVRWTGYVMPRYSETYTFYTSSDDGVRLWVNNQQLINQWAEQGETECSGTITLMAGVKYPIQLEYFDKNGGAVARLLWSSRSQGKQVIPKEALYQEASDSQVQLDLSSYFNEDAFSYDTKRNDGSYDGLSNTYSADLINKTRPYDDASYSFGPMGEGSKNSIQGKGQTLSVSEIPYKSIRLLGSATNGDQTGTFRIRYSDGSYSDFSVKQKDWCTTSVTGQNVYQTMNHRHADTADQIIEAHVFAYYITPSANKKVTGITLPNNENIHVLAITLLSATAADTQAPGAPANLTLVDPTAVRQTLSRAMSLTESTPVVDWPYNAVKLEWSASTDNVGVAGYEIYRDNQRLGTTTQTTYTDNNLRSGTTYTYTVRAFDAAGNRSGFSNPVSARITEDSQAPTAPANLTLVDPSASAASALRALALDRNTPVVEWPYDAVSLEWSASTDNVGVKGYEVFRNDEKIGSTDGMRYTDRNLRSGTTYTYKVRAYDAAGNKSDFSNSLSVKVDPVVEETNGTGLKGEYYDNKDLTKLKIARVDATVNFNWALESPHWSVGSDTFSVRWSGHIVPRYSEEYTFHTKTDDGVRLWVDNKLLINRWNDQDSGEHSGKIRLEAGKRYNIKMEYYDNERHAVAMLYWSSPSQQKEIIPQNRLFPVYTGDKDDDEDDDEDDDKKGRGLTGKYYDNKNFTQHKLTRVDETVNFNWGKGSPDRKINDNTFSVRWTGEIKVEKTGTYVFYTTADDGVRLWVNNRLIINDWRDHSATEKRGYLYLEAGEKYDIRLDYYENASDASMKLQWSGPGIKKQVIPSRYLYTD